MATILGPHDIVACTCGKHDVDEDDYMICCNTCRTWQHGECVGVASVRNAPKLYLCPTCKEELTSRRGGSSRAPRTSRPKPSTTTPANGRKAKGRSDSHSTDTSAADSRDEIAPVTAAPRQPKRRRMVADSDEEEEEPAPAPAVSAPASSPTDHSEAAATAAAPLPASAPSAGMPSAEPVASAASTVPSAPATSVVPSESEAAATVPRPTSRNETSAPPSTTGEASDDEESESDDSADDDDSDDDDDDDQSDTSDASSSSSDDVKSIVAEPEPSDKKVEPAKVEPEERKKAGAARGRPKQAKERKEDPRIMALFGKVDESKLSREERLLLREQLRAQGQLQGSHSRRPKSGEEAAAKRARKASGSPTPSKSERPKTAAPAAVPGSTTAPTPTTNMVAGPPSSMKKRSRPDGAPASSSAAAPVSAATTTPQKNRLDASSAAKPASKAVVAPAPAATPTVSSGVKFSTTNAPAPTPGMSKPEAPPRQLSGPQLIARREEPGPTPTKVHKPVRVTAPVDPKTPGTSGSSTVAAATAVAAAGGTGQRKPAPISIKPEPRPAPTVMSPISKQRTASIDTARPAPVTASSTPKPGNSTVDIPSSGPAPVSVPIAAPPSLPPATVSTTVPESPKEGRGRGRRPAAVSVAPSAADEPLVVKPEAPASSGADGSSLFLSPDQNGSGRGAADKRRTRSSRKSPEQGEEPQALPSLPVTNMPKRRRRQAAQDDDELETLLEAADRLAAERPREWEAFEYEERPIEAETNSDSDVNE